MTSLTLEEQVDYRSGLILAVNVHSERQWAPLKAGWLNVHTAHRPTIHPARAPKRTPVIMIGA